jgi:5'-methylthioadenosine nucleosidase
VAYICVAEMFSTPVIFPKPVTYIVDGEKPTTLEFLHNMLLDRSVTEVVGFISRKCISDISNSWTCWV